MLESASEAGESLYEQLMSDTDKWKGKSADKMKMYLKLLSDYQKKMYDGSDDSTPMAMAETAFRKFAEDSSEFQEIYNYYGELY